MTVADTMTIRTDTALLAALAAGDATALGELAERYGAFIRAAALRQTGDAATSDDITQVVLLVLSRKAASIAPRALPAWLHQTTRYAAANTNRAARRRRLHERAAARPEGVMSEQSANADAYRGVLDEAIAALREPDRRAIVGRYLLGQDVATVAGEFGVSARAAQKRIDRALARLRVQIGAARFRAKPVGRRVRWEPLTPAVVAVMLAAAAPSPASAVVMVAAPSAAVAALAKETMAAMLWAGMKTVAAALVTMALMAGVAAVAVKVALPLTAQSPPPPAASPTAGIPAAATSSPHAALANGVAIDFLGSSENQSKDGRFHSPDGRPLAIRPYARSGTSFGQRPGEVAREFAFKFDRGRLGRSVDPAHPTAATVRLNIQRSKPNDIGSDLATVYDTAMDTLDDVVAVVRSGKPDQEQSLVFDIAAGPWTARMASLPDRDQLVVAQDDIVHTKLTRSFDDEGAAAIGYWWTEFYSRPDRRLVAIDTDGQVHLPQQQSWDFQPAKDRGAEPVLDMPLPAMRLADMPLGQMIERLREETGLAINVDWPVLDERAGITPLTLVKTDRVGRMPLYHWLPYVFQNVHGTQGGAPTFEVKDGVVSIVPNDYRRPQLVWYRVPGLPIERLARFEVQTRPFDQWIAFDGLTMDLGQPSQLRVRTSDTETTPAATAAPTSGARAGASVVLPDESTVDLLAIGDAAGACWRPDGTPTSLPFDFQVTEWVAPSDQPNRRRLWLMTIIQKPDGGYVTGKADRADPVTAAKIPGRLTYTTRDETNVRFQVFEVEVDAAETTLDWRVDVASRPPWTATLNRGEEGWAADGVARVRLGDYGEAVVWGPAPAELFHGLTLRTAVRCWTPPTLGSAFEINGQFVETNGGGPNGVMTSAPDANGFALIGTREAATWVQRITVAITHYDQTAVFKNISLRPSVKTNVAGVVHPPR